MSDIGSAGREQMISLHDHGVGERIGVEYRGKLLQIRIGGWLFQLSLTRKHRDLDTGESE